MPRRNPRTGRFIKGKGKHRATRRKTHSRRRRR